MTGSSFDEDLMKNIATAYSRTLYNTHNVYTSILFVQNSGFLYIQFSETFPMQIKAVVLDINGTVFDGAKAAESTFKDLGVDPKEFQVGPRILTTYLLKGLTWSHP